MAGQASHVVRIPRSDEEGSFVLARVSPTGPASRPLNVRLVATEGMAPYVLALRHDRIDKLRGQNAPCSPDEWEQILTFLLLGRGSFDNVDATATVKEEATLTITIRKRVQNITQRLGTLSLAYEEDEGIELFEWCGEVVEERTSAVEDLVAAKKEQTNLQAAVDDLKAQLDEFLETKDADEAAMLEKFCLLLNEKKLKIRQQYRQLTNQDKAGAEMAKRLEAETEIKAEEESEEEEDFAPPPTSTRGKRGGAATRGRIGKVGKGAATSAARAKRGAKRRAAAALSEDEDALDDEIEKSEASARQKGKAAAAAEDEVESDTQSEDDGRTTENDDASTESEQEAEPEPEPMDEDVEVKEEEESPPKSKTTRGGKAQKPAAKKKAVPEQPPAPAQEEAPPPRRTLAFGKPKAAAPPPAISSKDVNMDGSDSESDDEL